MIPRVRQYTENITATAIALVAFGLYVVTLCPTTNFIDSGELATDAYTLGIAHPTGYPLFTLLGWMFSHIPLGFRIIYQMNLMAAVFCSAGLFVFFKFLVFFISELSAQRLKGTNVRKENQSSQSELLLTYVPAAFGTLVVGFSETYWSQALSVEVYSLHVVFLSLVLLLFTKAITSENDLSSDSANERKRRLYWYGFPFMLGLSFTNHMTTILLAPAFLYLYFATMGFSKPSWRRIGKMSIPFLVGLSVYFYLPFRASEHPVMNWGNPVSFERFMWHFSGKQYRVWMSFFNESASKQMQYFLDTLLPEFVYFPIALAGIGLWSLFKKNRSALVFTLLLFLGCVLYSINYDIHDIDSYFLLAYFTIAVWSALGVAYVLELMKTQFARRVVSAVLIASCALIVVKNFSAVDESKNSLVENYTRDMFNSIKPNGIVLTYQWDYFVSAAYYFQLVEHVRPDIVVIDKELMRRSWYYMQLEHRYPWLIEGVKPELDAFLHELAKFERDQPYDPSQIEFRYNALIHGIISKNISSHAVYATPELEQQYTSGYNHIPSGLAFQLFADTLHHEPFMPHFNFHRSQKSDTYIDGIQSMYARAYLNQAIYYNSINQTQIVLPLLDSALQIQPNFREAEYMKAQLLGSK